MGSNNLRQNKYKVTMIGSLPPIKGVSSYTVALLKELTKKENIEFINFRSIYPRFLYPGSSNEKQRTPQPVIENANVRNLLAWYNPFSWIYAGFSAKGEIIHAQWWSYVLAPIYLMILFIAKFLRRKKIVITVHNVKPHEPGMLKAIANKSILFLGDEFIVHTEINKQELAKELNISRKKINVIPHGLLLPSELMNVRRIDARRSLNISVNDNIILFFGIIRDYKGLDDLLEAMSYVVDKQKGAKLIVAGESWEKWSKYQALIDINNLNEHVVKFIKYIDDADIEPLFAAADLVALPYKHFNAQSGAGSLALSFRKALVVTNTGGLAQLIKNKEALVPPEDPDALARAIVKIISDDTLKQKLENDSKEVAKELSWASISKQTTSVYRKLLNK